MALWLLTDHAQNRTVLYDSVSEWAFGPGFANEPEAERFLNYAEDHGIPDGDVRSLSNEALEELHNDWLRESDPDE